MDSKKKKTLEELMKADMTEVEEAPEEERKEKEKPDKERILGYWLWPVVIVTVLLVLGISILGYKALTKNTAKEKEATKSQTTKPLANKPTTVYVDATGGLNLRQSASQTATEIAVVPDGTSLVIITTSGDWYEVDYNGQTGWVSKDFTSPNAP